MPETPRSYDKPIAVGDEGFVWSNRKWKPAVVISKSERGKSESFMVKAEDGEIVLVADLAKWKAGG